jgi:signal transduction histidine kinase
MLESRIQKVTEDQGALLRSILEQLQAIDVTGESSTAEQLMAIEQRNLSLEEEADTDAQLAQLGMAIEIINHEFSGTIRSIRDGLRKLKAWADVNEGLGELYDRIRTSFDHLDGYLTLFTPLQRRLYRRAVEIRCSEIRDFLEELFRARLARHSVTLVATGAFAKARIVGFPSSFYPVFVNLMDNAIFWLSQQNPQRERSIELDERDGTLLVADTGPGVDVRDREAIFEFGFSRKPGGRGMGLHIGRETLRRVGFDLRLIDADQGTAFAVVPVEES